MLKKCLVALSAALCLLATSCSAPKNITYMQGFSNDAVQAVRDHNRITVAPDDRLSIVVSSKDPELAQMFNLAISRQIIGQSSSSGNTSQTASFTVSPNGYIRYPILGDIYIAGLNRHQVADVIEQELVSNNLLKDPIVTVDFLNATVSILGDVKSPGEYSINNDNLTLLQALSMAGDLNITGLRRNVLVVREEDGQDRAYRVDLTNTQDLMQSPAYYLRQNDVIYVEPNDTKKRQATANGNSPMTPGFWMSLLSFVTTMVLIFVK
ncbi:MAG: polysaccharide biosynthesis/export family protein [Paramuribaculum sp.]|nr:polysaccharide biosynthesis/export family protein [Paramuribaculum sp.]